MDVMLGSYDTRHETFKSFAKPDTRGSGKSRSVDPTDKFCNHCNREGHDESSCFQLHGFSEWWGDRPRGSKGPGRGGGRTGRGGGRAGSGCGRGYGAPSVRANKTGGAGTSSMQAKASRKRRAVGDEAASCGLSTLDKGSAVQPVQQPAHEDMRDEGLENTVGEQDALVDSELGRGKRAKTPST
ncbi:hypothetical protein IFM89_012305 [Coptis chinensis]|uniref:Uncharacterized protein n=1 Tax=Coptis chinensis TaxID=261450 RepID=A0A835LM61_9MAGN|nr:hypothetical protein IFM89_012305 [Coptis chinensis]